MTRKIEKSVKIEMRVTPALKKRVQLAASMERMSVTAWIEAAIELALIRQLEKTGRTDER